MRPPSGHVPRRKHTASVNPGCGSWHSLPPNNFHCCGMLALDPDLPLLLRPDGSVQIGWDPARAVLVRPNDGLSVSSWVAILQSLPINLSAVLRLATARELGEPADIFQIILSL